MYNVCRHIKTNGCKCDAPALHGMPYCYFHKRLHRMIQDRKVGRPPAADTAAGTAPNASSDIALDLPAIEDRSAIQLALTQVLQDLGAKRLDPRRAGQLLYGLQIASQIVDRSSLILKREYVQTVSAGSNGEELGPAVSACDEDDDCDTCPQNQTCTRCVLSDEEEDDEDEE